MKQSENILEASHVSMRYAAHQALDDVSLFVPRDKITGLLGPNGAGKTTFIRIVNQIIQADEGQIFFQSEPLAIKHIAQIGYMPEERGLYKKMKVGEQLVYLARLKGLSTAEAKKEIKFWGERLAFNWWDKKIEDLSKGMQQKIQFVSTVIHKPKLIILDEPFSGFDPVNAQLITDEILELKKRGATIIFSTHRMETVEALCDHIIMFNKAKKVLQDDKTQVRESFKTNTFWLETDKELAEDTHFQLLLKQDQDHSFKYQLKFSDADPNQVLASLIAQGHRISHFSEVIPSMQDIFIQLVQKQ